ncbi:hypothetical protein [Nocardioides pyridinolyticus]
MRTASALAALLLVLAACGSEDGATATDPSGPSDAMPTAVPAAPGQVTTRGIVTVMDTGSPELCLGPVAESWPPQCGGPPIEGWDWADHDGVFERQQDTRWGLFVVTGTWDGATFGYDSAVPAALHNPIVDAEPVLPRPAVELSQGELDEIAEQVGSDLPGAQGAYAEGGHVLVDVIYDDGSFQAWVDEEHGAGVVVVSSMLVDAGQGPVRSRPAPGSG